MNLRLGLLLLTAWNAASFAAAPTLRLTIPRTAHAPTLDGKITPGEWDDAAAVTGLINQFDGVAHPRQATFWIKYDDTYVYVAQRSSLLAGEKTSVPAMPPLYFKDNQNTVVIGLAPGRVNSGDTPSHYRFLANLNSTTLVRRELCDRIKGVKFNSISSGLDSLDAVHATNSATAWNSFNADGTVWESEYAIPLAEMKVEKNPAGEEWGLLLARDYPQLDQNAIVPTTSYRFDWMARDWRNLAVINAYHLAKEYARVRLATNTVVVQVLELGDLVNGRIRPKLTLFNPTDHEATVTVQMSVARPEPSLGAGTTPHPNPLPQGERGHRSSASPLEGEAGPPNRGDFGLRASSAGRVRGELAETSLALSPQEQAVTLTPGERREWAATEIQIPENAMRVLALSVRDGGGTVLYQQAVPVQPGYGRERLEFVKDVWFGGRPKLCAGVVVPLPVYNPIHNLLWARISLQGRPEFIKAHTHGTVAVRRAGEPLPLATYPLTSGFKAWGDFEVKTNLPELKPGVYEVTANLRDDQDKLVARARDLFIRYDHAKDLPWIGNQIGVTNAVLPPWTPIVATKAKGGLALSCWGRRYDVDGSGLPRQITTLEENILSGPVRLELTRDGQPVLLKPATRVTHLKARPNVVEYQGALTGQGWKIQTTAHLEYDGYLLYKIRLEPQGTQRVDRIRLVIPLRDAAAQYLHAVGHEMRGMVSTLALKPDQGPLWDSSQQRCPTCNGAGLTVGNFRPYVWVGGRQRGLAFLADSDKDWVPDDTKKVPAIEVVREEVSGFGFQVSGQTPETRNGASTSGPVSALKPDTRHPTPDTSVYLVLNLVARPFTFTRVREVTFSLQATPVRPLAEDFRRARLQLSMGSAFPGGDPDGWSWDGAMLALNGNWYLGGHGSAPYPVNWERNIAYNQKAEQEGKVATKYQAMNAFFHHPEIDDPRTPGVQGANWYGYVQPEITTDRDIWDASISPTDVAYRIWRYQQWVRTARLHGFYFDNAYSCLSANPDLTGMGYVLDLPDRPQLDGQTQPGYAYTQIRDLLKRLRTVILAEGLRPYLWIHCTDTFVISAYAYADCLLDGENLPMITPQNPWFSEKWSPEYLQTLNDSAKWGLAIDFLDLRSGFEPAHLSALTRAAYRDYAGYLQVHDSEGGNTQNLNWHALDLGRPAPFLPYWDPAVNRALHTGETTTLVSAWRQDNALVVLAFNRSAVARPTEQLQIDLGALGLTAQPNIPFTVCDLDSGVPETELGAPLQAQVTGLQATVTVPLLPHNYRRFLVRPAHPLPGSVQTPVAIAGLQAWYRADAGCSGARWVDQGPQHRDLVQVDPAKQPALIPVALNRLPALRFSKDRPLALTATSPFTLGDSTVVFVYAVRNLNGSQAIFTIGTTPYRAFQFAGYLGWFIVNNALGDTGWFYLTQVDLGRPQVLTVTQHGAFVTVYENALRTPVKVGTLPGAPGSVTGPLTIGGQHDWDLAEVVIYDHVLSEKDRAALAAYLADRYGVP